MRETRSITLVISILAGILVFSSIIVLPGNNARVATVDEVKVSSKSVSKSLASHPPVYINGNANFPSANGVSNPSAAGTADDPYIIENWDINASTAYGIWVENTGKYFIIRNCVIHDGGSSYYGIYFYSVQNGKIDNVTSYNNEYGIFLGFSSNNQITNCTVYNNDWGIHLGYSSNNQITNCTAYNNVWGIELRSSSNNNITGNRIHNNFGGYGIRLDSSSNNTISNCAFYNNPSGISLYYSSNNNITNCNVYNNSYGIFLHYSSDNNITNSTVYNNTYGIDLWLDSSNNNITNCNVYNNDNGIHLHSNSVRSSAVADFDYSSEKLTDSDEVQFNLTSGIVLEEPEVNGSQVTLQWNKSTDTGFIAYIILRATHPNVRTSDTYVEEFLTVHTTSYVDTVPGPGTYYYRICEEVVIFELGATVWVGSNEQSVTVESYAATDFDYSSEKLTDSDEVQFNLTSSIVLEEPEVNGSQVTLQWNKSTDTGFIAYIILRATHPNVRTSDTYVEEFLTVPTTSYVDTVSGPGTYYYRIYEEVVIFEQQATGWFGSNEQSVTVESYAATDLDYSSEKLTDSDGVQFNLTSSIVLEKPEVNGSQVTLQWNRSANTGFIAYIILRATHPNVRTSDTYVEEFLTVPTTSYVDTVPGPGTYYYRVFEKDLVFDLEAYVCVGSNEQSIIFYPNLIYNNYFNNTINAYDDGNNIWSITKTEETNILGDSYLGGNYWSDYAGVDLDGDGLGDTPYDIAGGSNKDYLPLVMSPEENISFTNFTIVNLTGLNISYVVNITNGIIINISRINITNLMSISVMSFANVSVVTLTNFTYMTSTSFTNVSLVNMTYAVSITNTSFANVFEVTLGNLTYITSSSFINVSYINITQSMDINNLMFNNVSYVYLQNVTNVNFVITAIPNITIIAYENLQIAIPVEALTLSMPFNLSTTSASLPPGYNVVGDIYKIECGVSIAAPINITLSYAGIVLSPGMSEDDLAIYKKVGDNWIKINSIIDKLNDTVSVEVTSFSDYAILYKQPSIEGEEGEEPTTKSFEILLLYIIIVVIIIIVLVAAGIGIRRRKKGASPPEKPASK